ncbi:inovirus Gp2 family protein [Rahnella aquatilis]|nr:inovirus Gp2 family protein [Rahnella aquatilis]AZP48245.1 inovirus Gp2 family protein [Rahnella aquatilis]
MKYDLSVYGELKREYLEQIEKTVGRAKEQYTRVMAIRVDFRLPANKETLEQAKVDSAVITRCMKSLSERIKADLKRRKKAGKRIYHCKLRYVWVREFNKEGKKHYHALLLLNREVYFHLGDYLKPDGTLASMISGAWMSALGLSCPKDRYLTQFPANGYYYLDKNGQKHLETCDAMTFRTSYLAKVATKSNADGERNFGCSQG